MSSIIRAAEVLFTAYTVPALLVPLVWVAGPVLRRAYPADSAPRLGRIQRFYFVLAMIWLAVGIGVRLGLPVEAGGKAVALLSWCGYAALNLNLALLLVAFTREFGGLPEGDGKDRLFLRFLSIIVMQPLVTAFAFSVLYRIMGLVYHLDVPPLPGVQEGI
jgi:hypothetical protein